MKAFNLDPSHRHVVNLNKIEDSKLERKTSDITKRYATRIQDYEEERKELKKRLQDIQAMRNTSPTDSPRLIGHPDGVSGQSLKLRENGNDLTGSNSPVRRRKLRPHRLDTTAIAQATSTSVRFDMEKNESFPSPVNTPPCSPQFKTTFDWIKMAPMENFGEANDKKMDSVPSQSESADKLRLPEQKAIRHGKGKLDCSDKNSLRSSSYDSPMLRRAKALHASPVQSPRSVRRAMTPTLGVGSKAVEPSEKFKEKPQKRPRAMTADSASLRRRQGNKTTIFSTRSSDLDKEVKEIMDKNTSHTVHEARSHLRKYEGSRNKTEHLQPISLDYREHSPVIEVNASPRKVGDKLFSTPRLPADRNGHPTVTGVRQLSRTRNLNEGKPPLVRYHSIDNLTMGRLPDMYQSDRNRSPRTPSSELKPSRSRLRRTSSLEDISVLLQKMKMREAVNKGESQTDDGTESLFSVATSPTSPRPPLSKGWATVRSKMGFADRTVTRAEERKPTAKLKKIVEQFILNARTADVIEFNRMKNLDKEDDGSNLSNSLEDCRYLRKYVPKSEREGKKES
ncbi:uncharacterized protein [Ptychodera flava]|uniref:uncharacterized protein n=1 Tax=Ptychodera flava TaxID=63121 RepID=UPI00396A1DC2